MQAYKRAALKYHPDKATAGDRDEAEKKFKQVNAANSILSDPAKRQRYDAGRTPARPLLIDVASESCALGRHSGPVHNLTNAQR